MKNVLAIILITTTLIFLSGCGDNKPQTQADNNPIQNDLTQMPAENQIDISKEVNNFDNLINKENLSFDDCKTLKEERLIDLCNAQVYTLEAIQKLDPSSCEKIKTDYEKSTCKARVEFFKNAPSR